MNTKIDTQNERIIEKIEGRNGSPPEFYLGTTPLNESLVVMNKLVPMFKKKYNIEKLTFITLTDGLQIVIIILVC